MASSTTGKKRVTFELQAPPGRQVAVAGNFNDWAPGTYPLKEQKPGLYRRTIYLPKGEYEYKFVVDGVWTADPLCPLWAPNEHGTLNSVLRVV